MMIPVLGLISVLVPMECLDLYCRDIIHLDQVVLVPGSERQDLLMLRKGVMKLLLLCYQLVLLDFHLDSFQLMHSE